METSPGTSDKTAVERAESSIKNASITRKYYNQPDLPWHHEEETQNSNRPMAIDDSYDETTRSLSLSLSEKTLNIVQQNKDQTHAILVH